MRQLAFFVVLLLATCGAWGQQTPVVGQVIGPNTHVWANGTAHASLVCPGNAQAYIGHTPIARDTPTVALDGTGTIHQTLYDYAFMVDVNGAAISCNYVYRITEQCSIANFSTNPLTGITGTATVNLTTQINATSVNLSPQCDVGAGSVTSVNTFTGAVTVTGGTNVTVTNSSNTITINAASATGCTIGTLLDQWVLSIHPNATCYGSIDWTWDDTNHNEQTGDGTTTLTGTNVNTFTKGAHNALTDLTDVNIAGNHNTVTCDSNTIGSTNCDLFSIAGANNTITDTGAGTNAFNLYQYARGASISSTGGSTLSYVMQLLSNNSATAGTGGNIDVTVTAGQNNQITSSGTGSITSSIYQFGESNAAGSTGGGNNEDVIQLGENNASNANGASSVTGFSTQTGYNNTFLSQGGHGQSFAFELGHLNTATSTTAATTDFGIIGRNGQLTDCSHCYLFGENGGFGSGDSNKIGIGFSATPEIVVKSGIATVTGTLNLNGPTLTKVITFTFCASGCDITGTPCTTGSASYNSCDTTINFSALGTMPDAHYSAICNGVGPVDPAHNDGANWGRVTQIGIENTKTTTSLQPIIATQGSTAVSWVELDCTLSHR